MTGEPGVFQGRGAVLPAADRLRKRHDVKANAVRVLKGELALALEGNAVLVAGHAVETPDAEPVVGRIALAGASMGLACRFRSLHGSRFSVGYRSHQPGHRHQCARKLN